MLHYMLRLDGDNMGEAEVIKMVNDRLGVLSEQMTQMAQQLNQLVGKQDMREVLCKKHNDSMEIVHSVLFGKDEGSHGLITEFAVVKRESGDSAKFIGRIKDGIVFGSATWLIWTILNHLFPNILRIPGIV